MIGTTDTYYLQQEVSNSDLSKIADIIYPTDRVLDLSKAYRFGNLVDAMITEPHRCNHLTMRVDDEPFFKDEWETARAMLNAFRKDAMCMQMLKMASGQAVKVVKDFKIEHEGIQFSLDVRCKYDLWMQPLGYGGDIKSTACTSQKQFEDSIEYFDYDRQRAWYMDISGAEKDVLIGISKASPHKIFKIPIDRNHRLYKSGKEKYQHLSFMYHTLFSGIILNKQAA